MFIINILKSFKRNKFVIEGLLILSFILLSIIGIVLLFNHNTVYVGYDTQFHFKRLMEIKEGIMHGNNLLPNYSFNYFHGSIVMSLYPYLTLLPTLILSFIVHSSVNLIYIIFMFNIFLTFIISFYSSRNYIKSNITSYIFSVIYSLSNLFLYHNIITSDFGIVYSYIFLPLVIFSFIKIIQGSNNWIGLSIGMTLVLFSHILNTVYFIIFLLIFLLINLNKINTKIFYNFCKAVILFLMISSIVWLPFLSSYLNNLHGLNMPDTSVFKLDRVGIKPFLSGLYGNTTNNTIGFFPIISMIISIFFYHKFDRYVKQMYLLSLSIIFIVLFIPWKIIISKFDVLQPLNQIQMTSRLFIIPVMILSFIFALIISKFIISIKVRHLLYFLTIFLTIFFQLIMGQSSIIRAFSGYPSIGNHLPKDSNSLDTSNLINYHIKNNIEFTSLLSNYSASSVDYIPKASVLISPYVNQDLGFYNNHHQIKINPIKYNTFNFSSDENNINKLSLPIYVYNKEKLYVYLNDKQVNNYSNKNGLLTIDNIQRNIKPNNNVYIKPSYNPYRIAGIIISILGWLFILIILIKWKFVK